MQDCKDGLAEADGSECPALQMQTVPYLIDNPEVGYVQTRWIFANPDESYLTKAQEISLNFHCKCEQFVHFASGSFFNFNGTAGDDLCLIWHGALILAACIRQCPV